MIKRTLAVALPLVLPNVSQQIITLINSALMGHLAASQYLAATGIGTSVLFFLAYLFSFLRMSTTGFVAQCYARQEWLRIRHWLLQSLLVAFVLSLIIIALRTPIYHIVRQISGMSEPVARLFQQYFTIAVYSLIGIFANYTLLGFFIGIQRAMLGLVMALINMTVSMTCSCYCVLVLGMKISGIAIGLVMGEISMLVFALSMSMYIFKQQSILSLDTNRPALLELAPWIKFLTTNRDILIRSLCIVCVIQSFFILSTYLGKNNLAANQLLFQLSFLLMATLDAIQCANETLVGEAFARDRLSQLRHTITITACLMLAIALIYTLVLTAGRGRFIHSLTSLAEVRSMAYRVSALALLLPLLSAPSTWLDGIFIGLLQTRRLRNAMLISATGYATCVTILIPWGNRGLWMALLLFFVFRSVTLGHSLRVVLRQLQHRASEHQYE